MKTIDSQTIAETIVASAPSPPKVSDLISLYRIDVEIHLLAIAASRAKKQYDDVARHAHAIAGMSDTVGAIRASKLASALERACRDGATASTYRLISELQDACAAASDAMNACLNRTA